MNIEKLKEITKNFFEKTSLNTEEISVEEKDNYIWIKIKTKDSKLLIGPKGKTLGEISWLIKRIIEKIISNESPEFIENYLSKIIIDINDYWQKRVESLKTLAHILSERAIFFKSDIEVEPLPPHERKVIHEFLANKQNIRTESVGIGDKRRVIIKYISKKEEEI